VSRAGCASSIAWQKSAMPDVAVGAPEVAYVENWLSELIAKVR
jgi:hypothetical protein